MIDPDEADAYERDRVEHEAGENPVTALDPSPIIRDLREELRAFGQYRPETVDRLIAATERTAQWPLPHYRPQPSPMPRGGRSTYPTDRDAAVIPFRSSYCNARHPSRILLCGESPNHRGVPHRAYGEDDRVIDEWPVERVDTPEVGA